MREPLYTWLQSLASTLIQAGTTLETTLKDADGMTLKGITAAFSADLKAKLLRFCMLYLSDERPTARRSIARPHWPKKNGRRQAHDHCTPAHPGAGAAL